MKTQNLFMTMMFLFLTLIANAQENKTKIWGELTMKPEFGINLNYGKKNLIYHLEYLTPIRVFGEDKSPYLSSAEAGVDYIIPNKSKYTDFLVGGSAGYQFSYELLDPIDPPYLFPEFDYEVKRYSSICGSVNAKFNYNFSKHVGIGLATRASFSELRTEISPQVRILVGNLR